MDSREAPSYITVHLKRSKNDIMAIWCGDDSRARYHRHHPVPSRSYAWVLGLSPSQFWALICISVVNASREGQVKNPGRGSPQYDPIKVQGFLSPHLIYSDEEFWRDGKAGRP